MKTPPHKRNRKSPSSVITLVAGFAAAITLLIGDALRAAAPGDPAVEMTFSEGSGISTVNSGYLGGTASLDAGTTTNGFPMFTNNVPSGPYTPAGNTYAMDFGPVEVGQGGRKIDLSTDNGPLGTLGNFIGGITVCGWINSRDNGVGSGGNRIAFALETPNGLGFDVMQRGSGSMGFNVNQYNDGGPASTTGLITADAGAGASNWVFFAVTYDPSLASSQVKFFFGRTDRLAAFDVARTYSPPPTNQIEYTGLLTVGNFSSVEGQYSATGTGSRTYRGLIDQLRIYTNVFSIDEIQQAQLESASVPAVPATILRQPTNVTVTAGPYKSATFSVEAHGSGALTYQWLTNDVAVPGATNRTITFATETGALDGTKINVLVDNALTTDPGNLSDNAFLYVIVPPTPDEVILTTADMLYNGTAVLNNYSQSQQINWGLGGSGGVATAAGRRSFMLFALGTNRAASAKLKMWNYWGGPPVNGQGRLPEANTRIYGTLTNAPQVVTEPPPNSNGTLPGFVPLDNTNFYAISPDQIVGPGIGWYEFDITGWYNACLGQTTTIMLRASATSGFDFPLYEDREGTAYTAGAGGTAANTGPRIEVLLPPPSFINVSRVGNDLVMSGSYGKPGRDYVLLASPDVTMPLGSWTRVLTNQFDVNGNFSETRPIAPGSTQNYYRLLLP